MSDERLKAIWMRTVEKMKEVVREFHVTEDELHLAGRYFNRLGQSGMCPSLFDVALAITSIEASGRTTGGTRANLEGPYHAAHPLRPDGNLLDHPAGPNAQMLLLEGTVTDAGTGRPVAGARLDFWHADENGRYDREGDNLRGIVTSDAHGHYRLDTIVPSDYDEHDHDPIGELFRAMGQTNTRSAHIHLKVSVDGREYLTTQLFLPTSKVLANDYVVDSFHDDLLLDLVSDPSMPTGQAFKARFDVALVGMQERATA